MKIYTKGGDGGETGLYGGARVRKDDVRVEAYGTIDELNAALGLAASSAADAEIRESIVAVQQELFAAGWDLSTPVGAFAIRMTDSHAVRLEGEIDRFEAELEPLRNFILPGGSPDACALHLARCICRRAERRVVSLMQEADINPEVEKYLNRLSDHLFVLARLASRRAAVPETLWKRPT
jgi:cob(I)alamin adenosyltransferase